MSESQANESAANHYLACSGCVNTTYYLKQEGVEIVILCEGCGKEVHRYE